MIVVAGVGELEIVFIFDHGRHLGFHDVHEKGLNISNLISHQKNKGYRNFHEYGCLCLGTYAIHRILITS